MLIRFILSSLTVLLITGAAQADNMCPDTNGKWNLYTGPDREFTMEYPSTIHAEISRESIPGLLSRTLFISEQPYQFSVTVSVWNNPEHLSPKQWATEKYKDPRLVSNAGSRWIAGRNGYVLHVSTLAFWVVETFVGTTDRMYELNYVDMSDEESTPAEIRTCRTDVLDKMVTSFTLNKMLQ